MFANASSLKVNVIEWLLVYIWFDKFKIFTL